MRELEPIKKRAAAASPGPWSHIGQALGDDAVIDADGNPVATASTVYPECVVPLDGADADFIAHAREDVPALIAENERLRNCLKWWVSTARDGVWSHVSDEDLDREIASLVLRMNW